MYLSNTDTTFVGVISGVLSPVYHDKVDYAKSFTKTCQTAVSTHLFAHFFNCINVPLRFKSTTRTTSSSRSTISTLPMVRRRSYFGFLLLYDDAVFDDRDNTIMRETDDNNLSKSDNFDTQLYTKVNLRALSEPSLGDLPQPQDCPTAATQQAEHI